jgi:hypothetical protein
MDPKPNATPPAYPLNATLRVEGLPEKEAPKENSSSSHKKETSADSLRKSISALTSVISLGRGNTSNNKKSKRLKVNHLQDNNTST